MQQVSDLLVAGLEPLFLEIFGAEAKRGERRSEVNYERAAHSRRHSRRSLTS
jgi:hypothetical protein